jgi:hypothetical protein
MATTYEYFVSDITNLATKITTITTRLNIDPGISPVCLPVTSVVYNSPNLEITFPNPLTQSDLYIVGRIFRAIFENFISGVDYHYNNLIGTCRDVVGTSAVPTTQFDVNCGYNVGSVIYNPSGTGMYVCLDSTSDAAIWLPLDSSMQLHSHSIFFNSGGSLSTNSFIVSGSGQVASEINAQVLMTEPGIVKDLYVFLDTAPGVGNDRTFTVRLNGVDTALTTTLSDATTQQANTVDNFAVTTYDRISILHTSTGTPTSTTGIITITYVS